MRKSIRERKTSSFFKQRNFDLSYENDDDDEEFELEIQEYQKKPKRKYNDITQLPTLSSSTSSNIQISTSLYIPSPPSLMPALCCETLLLKRKKTDISIDNIRFLGYIEYSDGDDVYTIEEFKFKPNRNKGYSFETERFSINNFGVGNHIFFFLKKKNSTPFDLVFKISPCENKIEVSNDVLHYESSTSSQSVNTLLVDTSCSTKNYVKKNDSFYPDVDLLFSSKRNNHLELVFRDVNTKIPFCTFNIQTKV